MSRQDKITTLLAFAVVVISFLVTMLDFVGVYDLGAGPH